MTHQCSCHRIGSGAGGSRGGDPPEPVGLCIGCGFLVLSAGAPTTPRNSSAGAESPGAGASNPARAAHCGGGCSARATLERDSSDGSAARAPPPLHELHKIARFCVSPPGCTKPGFCANRCIRGAQCGAPERSGALPTTPQHTSAATRGAGATKNRSAAAPRAEPRDPLSGSLTLAGWLQRAQPAASIARRSVAALWRLPAAPKCRDPMP